MSKWELGSLPLGEKYPFYLLNSYKTPASYFGKLSTLIRINISYVGLLALVHLHGPLTHSIKSLTLNLPCSHCISALSKLYQKSMDLY